MFSNENLKSYKEEYGMPNHREILYFEVVIDVDSETKEAGKMHADVIEQILNQSQYKYKRWYSGGTGQHFHLNFRLLAMKNLCQNYSVGEIRLAILKYIIPKELLTVQNSHICLHNKTLIQIEYMAHRKGQVKTLLSKVEGINNIPDKVIYNLYIQKKKEREAIKLKEADIKKNKHKKIKEPTPECIRFFEGEQIYDTSIDAVQDGIYRILFALVNFYLQRGTPHDHLEELMVLWRESLPKDWLEKSKKKVSNSIIRYMINKSNGSAGCRYRSLILEDIRCSHICKNCPYKTQQ